MTRHPGRIRREFTMDFPRPRRPDDPDVRARARQILNELRIPKEELAP
jgi:ABC-type nitrate/sulfonate/bicarbonate transport system ATPase subunit